MPFPFVLSITSVAVICGVSVRIDPTAALLSRKGVEDERRE
jgi:hypothetical protein